jgi:HEPN domain-containing protein
VFTLGDLATSVEDWCRIATRAQASARTLLSNKHTAEAWGASGFAVECALKAAIMSRHRFNRWPSREERPDLYSHDLRHLFAEAGIDLQALIRDPPAPKLQTVLLWRRGEGYNPKAMPEKVARDIVDAALGPEGVIEWLCMRFRLTI